MNINFKLGELLENLKENKIISSQASIHIEEGSTTIENIA